MLSIAPSSRSVTVGTTATTDVMIEGVSNLYTFDVRLSFDPSLVHVVEIEPGGFVSPDWQLQKTIDNESGLLVYALSQLRPTEPVSGTGPLVTITWRGVATGTSPISFTHQELYHPGGGAPIPAATENGEITVIEEEANIPPMADAGGPYSGTRADVVTLDGSASDDGDATIVTYEWRVGGIQVYEGPADTWDLDLAGYNLDGYGVVLTITDDEGAKDDDTTTLTVTNAPPVAVDDITSINEEKSVVIDVTTNDYDPDGEIDPTTVTIVQAADHGVAEVDGSTGVVTYTPDIDFSGVDSFTYTVEDNDGATSNEATVTITDVGPAPETTFIYLPLVVSNGS